METTSRLGLPLLAAAQAQKHVTHNEALLQLDALCQISVVSRAVSAEPSSPGEGESYILPAGAMGPFWSGQPEGQVAHFRDGAWFFYQPREGWIAFVRDTDETVLFDGNGWGSLGRARFSQIGINADADATNRLSANTRAVLFNREADDIQVKLNKEASGNTAAFVFQTGFSSRAEIGLVGDDDFQFKVSPDGAAFTDALRLTPSEVVVNEGGADLDFRVESDGKTHALFVRGGDSRVGIGTSNPSHDVELVSTTTNVALKLTANDFATVFVEADTGDSGAGDPSFRFLIAGTEKFRFGVTNTDDSFAISSGTLATANAEMRIYNGGGMTLGSPTGGDRGLGTLNAQAVYDDDTLLTCYVIEAWLGGRVDTDKWDALAPDRVFAAETNEETGEILKAGRTEKRTHERARGFNSIAADRLDLDAFASWIRTNRRLPAFPGPEHWADPEKWNHKMSTGDLTQRLWETVELLAVHVIGLHERLKTIETQAKGGGA